MERSRFLLSRMLSMIHCLCYIYMMIMANCFTAGALGIAHTNFSTDQSALLALKAHITSDPQNILTANWSSASNFDICNWVGVTCGARHHRVTALNLSYMGLAGVIPPHLGNLSFLIELSVENNSFHGPLPQELSRLRRLKKVCFGNNNFMGTIPSWFGSFAKLQIFILYGNGFSGFIPAAIFNLSGFVNAMRPVVPKLQFQLFFPYLVVKHSVSTANQICFKNLHFHLKNAAKAWEW